MIGIVAKMVYKSYVMYQTQASPYSSPGYSFLKALSMTTGDVGTDSFFGLNIRGMTHDTSHLQYIQLSTFFWLLSLVLMTILLSNLLVSSESILKSMSRCFRFIIMAC